RAAPDRDWCHAECGDEPVAQMGNAAVGREGRSPFAHPIGGTRVTARTEGGAVQHGDRRKIIRFDWADAKLAGLWRIA
ncbi:MAG: hypothetical protein KDJ18_02460, partial [Hyphomicrobiaceae bacterium]|nr:hypothetical protein [Hyphomicrobiaceae bacterium]